MKRNRGERESVPLTLGQALAAKARLMVWCKGCVHRAEPEVAELVAHHGACMTVDRLGGAATVPAVRRAVG